MVAMLVLSHAIVAAQLEAFSSVDGGLGNSKDAELGFDRDIVMDIVREDHSIVAKTSSLASRSCIHACVLV